MLMPTQLNQILAIEKGVKSRAQAEVLSAQQNLNKAVLLSGISRTYQPKDDEGEKLPPESTRVVVRATNVLDDLRATLTRLFDVTLTKDVANGSAKADIVVDGVEIAKGVPAVHLLFLEKQLADLLGFVAKLPVLDPADQWAYDPNLDAFATEPSRTVRTKKIPRNHVLAEATAQHPAQVQIFTEDVLVGYWTTVKTSGALPQAKVTELTARVVKLAEAVKSARERANTTPVTDQHIGENIFSYLLGS